MNAIEIYIESWASEAFGFRLPMLLITEDVLNGSSRSELRNVRAIAFDSTYFSPDARYEIQDVGVQ